MRNFGAVSALFDLRQRRSASRDSRSVWVKEW